MRAGYLVVGALILALVAAGVLIWTGALNLSGRPGAGSETTTTAPATTTGPTSPDAQLVTMMNDVAMRGGYAATFSEPSAKQWQLAAGHRLERFGLNNQGAVFARLTSSAAVDPRSLEWHTQGLFWLLPVEFANRTNGKRIEIGIVARQPRSNGAPALTAAYSTRQSGNSAWKYVALGPEFGLHKFVFDVPLAPDGYTNQPILVINSDANAGGKAVEILGAYVKPAAE
jgi:hypothetical protein